MNADHRNELARYRINRAKETLSEAKFLINNGLSNTAVNRLYYACFYAVTALLIKNDIVSNTHAGTRKMFGLHFIKTKIIDSELGKFYTDIFDKRQIGDYGDFIVFKIKDVKNFIEPASQLIEEIEKLIA